jgi:hypothetical protein
MNRTETTKIIWLNRFPSFWNRVFANTTSALVLISTTWIWIPSRHSRTAERDTRCALVRLVGVATQANDESATEQTDDTQDSEGTD